MACFHPVKATQSFKKKSNGKYAIYFGEYLPDQGNLIELPCGQCSGCRLERTRQWAIRCMHEASMYEKNCFITLTYNDANLPEDKSVNLRDFQLFMKRLRKKYVPINPYDKETQYDMYLSHQQKYEIRFFHCGEYGELCSVCNKSKDNCTCVKYIPGLGRPHYHACIFNFDFSDKELYSDTDGQFLYTSESLNQIWQNGLCWIGDVTFQSAAYVARYIMKKITGDMAKDHYKEIDKLTGEIKNWRRPEYASMSNGRGLGKAWLEKYQMDVYPHDYVIVNGKKVRPPKYYDVQYELGHPIELEAIKEKRKTDALKHSDDNTDKRLKTRERLTELRIKQLKRKLPND